MRPPAAEINREALRFAASACREANRENPADKVLRLRLKEAWGFSPEEKRQISELVFAFYRWFQWLDGTLIEDQIEQALRIDERFAAAAKSFTDKELTRAVPAWSNSHVDWPAATIRQLQERPPLWLRTRPGNRQEVAGAIGDSKFHPILPTALRSFTGNDLFKSAEFQAGAFEIQDISSQAVTWVAGPKPGETWWDVCAGEGGKTLHFSDLMENRGLIWATDAAEWRLKRLKLRAARAKAFNYRARPWKSGEPLPTKTLFDGILIDAPCSGLGTWQRNPHARWTTQARDVRELAVIQADLITQAASCLKPGGRLIYSACTLTHAETAGVCDAVAQKRPELKPLGIQNPLERNATPQERLWLWPHESNGNGMFIAAWTRV